jgi:hypothetical protein
MRAGGRRALASRRARAWPYPLLAAVTVAMGCGGRVPPPSDPWQPPRQPELRPLPEEFDPETVGDDLLLIEPAGGSPPAAEGTRTSVVRPTAPVVGPPQAWSPPAADGTVPNDTAAGPPPATAGPQRLVKAFGWRVLLDKVHSYQEAEQVRQEAMGSLARTDIDIRFTAPWYNVEMGHYRAEAEAQLALERVKERFANALKIRGQIYLPAEE